MDIRRTYVNAFDNFPILKVADGVAVTRRGELVVGFSVTLPPVFTLRPDEYAQLSDTVSAALKLLPVWTVVHKQDVFSMRRFQPEEDGSEVSFLRSEFLRKFTGREILSHSCHVYLTFSSKAVVTGSISNSGFFGLLARPAVPGREQVEAAVRGAEEFAGLVNTGGILRMERLKSDDDWVTADGGGVLSEYVRLGGEGSVFHEPDTSRHDRVVVGDKVLQAFEICESGQLPAAVSCCRKNRDYSGTGADVFLSTGAFIGPFLSCEHVVNQYFVTVPQQQVKTDLRGKANRMGSMAERDSANKINGTEIEEFLDAVEKDSDQLVYSHLNVLFWSSADGIDAARQQVRASLFNMGLTAVSADFDCPLLFWCGCPGGGAELGAQNWFLQPAPPAVAFGMFDGFDEGLSGGSYFLSDRFRRTPLKMDFGMKAYDLGKIDDYNMSVIGPTGSGKSFFMNHLLQNRYENGETVFVMDMGHSYEGLCRYVRETSDGREGAYLSWDRVGSVCVNPLEGCSAWMNEAGVLSLDDTGLLFFRSLLLLMWTPVNGWRESEMSVLDTVISGFLGWLKARGVGSPVFDDFCRYVALEVQPRINYQAPLSYTNEAGDKVEYTLEEVRGLQRGNGFWNGEVLVTGQMFDVSSFLNAVQMYDSSHAYGSLFSGGKSVDLVHGRFTVFELDKLAELADSNESYVSLCIFIILHAVTTRLDRMSGFKTILIDEGWKFLANQVMAPYLAGAWRTARKKSTSMVIATQSVEDLLSSEQVGRAIFDNTSIRILLDQSRQAGMFSRLSALLSLNETDSALVVGMRNGIPEGDPVKPVFVKAGFANGFSGVYLNDVSKAQALVFESNFERKKPLWALADRLESEGVPKPFIEAVKRMSS